jgi:NarL family two-component system response regulator LiaR
LEVVLAAQDDMELVGQASDGEEAILLAHEHHPDVIIMDLQMPVKDGLTAIRELDRAGLGAQILVLTSFPDDDNVFAAIKTGATGFVLKESAPEDLLDAIRTVHRGESALHPTVARRLVREIKRPTTVPASVEPLTQREMDVLRCLALGWTNREIAGELCVSVRTVTTHVRNILDKLHLANRTQAALYAVEQGFGPAPKKNEK